MSPESTRCPFNNTSGQCVEPVGHKTPHRIVSEGRTIQVGHMGTDDRLKPDEVPGYPYPDKTEMVNHPSHYGGDVEHEHWKCMVGWGLVENAFLYNCTKYLCRVGKKQGASPLEDLEKARWYLERAIEQCKASSS